VYAELATEYIEGHYLTPPGNLPLDTVLNLNPRTDFAVLCANCHLMIHRSDSVSDLADFRQIIRCATSDLISPTATVA